MKTEATSAIMEGRAEYIGKAMTFAERYELLGVRAEDDECRTFEARDVSSGRQVLVHMLLPSAASTGRTPLLDLARRRPCHIQIVELYEWGDNPYLVTEIPTQFSSLRAWLEEAEERESRVSSTTGQDRFAQVGKWKTPGVRAEPEVTKAEAPSQPAEPGEFTRLFEAPPASRQAEPAAPPEVEPGEFTRMFQTPEARAAPEPERAPSMEHPPPSSREAGESSRMFEAGSPAAPSEPGEFTRMMQAQAPREPARPPAVAPPQPQARGGQPGDFTRLFVQGAVPGQPSWSPQAPEAPSVPPAIPVSPQRGTGATQLFSTPGASPPPAAPEGPSEFTRIIATPSAPVSQPQGGAEAEGKIPAAEASPSSTPEQTQPSPPSRPSYLPLIIIMNVLFLIALAVVLYFVFSR